MNIFGRSEFKDPEQWRAHAKRLAGYLANYVVTKFPRPGSFDAAYAQILSEGSDDGWPPASLLCRNGGSAHAFRLKYGVDAVGLEEAFTGRRVLISEDAASVLLTECAYTIDKLLELGAPQDFQDLRDPSTWQGPEPAPQMTIIDEATSWPPGELEALFRTPITPILGAKPDKSPHKNRHLRDTKPRSDKG